MSQLQTGEVVQLKSGGPRMTIAELGNYGPVSTPGVKCVWFENNKPFERVFPPEVLERCQDGSNSARVAFSRR